MDTYILILLAVIAIASVPLILYIMLKKLQKTVETFLENPISMAIDKIEPEKVEKLLQTLINNEKFQRFLFETGAILGNGAKQGIGIDKLMAKGKSGGGMLGQLLGLYMQFKNGGAGNIVQGIAQQPTETTQNINTNLDV